MKRLITQFSPVSPLTGYTRIIIFNVGRPLSYLADHIHYGLSQLYVIFSQTASSSVSADRRNGG
jgi:hypothetical protein